MNDNRITVTDIDIPFGRMIGIILKLMLASIPAILLFYLVFFGIAILFSAFFGGFATLLAM
jgi:hypothetical protein